MGLIDRRRVGATALVESERPEAILNSIGDAVLSTNLAGHVTYLNSAAESMTGWSRAAAVGRSLDDVFHIIDRDTREPVPNPMSLAIQLNKTVGLTATCLLVRQNGQEIAIEDSAAPVRDRSGVVRGAVIVFRDVGAALETSRLMSHQAQHDALTGLPNRLLLHDRLTQAIALGHRRRKPLAVLFADVDGFKAVNDSLGHSAGDQILRSVAERLRRSLRPSDTVSRVGGDEFVIVLSEIEHSADAALVARKLIHAVAASDALTLPDLRVTASIGIAVCPDHGQDPDVLIARADTAMYIAKRAGPGSYRGCDAEGETSAPVTSPTLTTV
jgi:diguanylate cyclase (GGDEF)-like protein/PAS domain S-box-containing protein